jgi:hypothetical protein
MTKRTRKRGSNNKKNKSKSERKTISGGSSLVINKSSTDSGNYIGDVLNGKREGKGVMSYINRTVYRGDWKNDKRHGKGVLRGPNGSKYDGEWIKGHREGLGMMRYSNGDIYNGSFLHGKREGFGTIYYKDEDASYSGNWFQDELENAFQDIDDLPNPIPYVEPIKTVFKNVNYNKFAFDVMDPTSKRTLFEQMKEEDNYVAFHLEGENEGEDYVATIPREALINLSNPNESDNAIVYECLKVGNPNEDDIVFDKPLFNLSKIGLFDFINNEYMKDVIKSKHRHFLITQSNKPDLKSVISDNLINHSNNSEPSLGMNHCQDGKGGKLYIMKYLKETDTKKQSMRRIVKSVDKYFTRKKK